MPLKIVRNDITKMTTEAIVNTANEYPTVGEGCDMAIYKAAGFNKLLALREKIGRVPEGEAFITPGFNLEAKYIIHTVSPRYIDGESGEEEKLRKCYRNSLKLAAQNGIHSISFPLIATGSYGYPKTKGIRIAADEINAFLLYNDMMVVLVVYDETSTRLGRNLYPSLHNYLISRNTIENSPAQMNSVPAPMAPTPRPVAEARHASFMSEPLDRTSEATQPLTGRQRVAKKDEKKVPQFAKLFTRTFGEAKEGAGAFQGEHEFTLELEAKLKERLKHTTDTFSQYLLYLIEDKGLQNVDVYTNALVTKKVFSKIKNNPDYHPEKITALKLCVGAKLNLDETKDILARAGYALSPCDMTDMIFSFFIENEIYDLVDLDIQLEEYGLPCIIKED